MQLHPLARAILMLSVLPLLGALPAGCKRSGEQKAAPQGLGRQLVEGEVHDLRLTPDGQTALFLGTARKPMMGGIPPAMLQGELQAAPVSGGGLRHLAKGVVNVPGGYLITSDSRYVLALADYDVRSGSGTLQLFDLKSGDGKGSTLGQKVTYMLPSPDAKTLAFIEGGVLRMGPLPSGPFKEVASDVQQAAYSKDGARLAYKQRLSSDGALWILPSAGGEPKRLGEQVGDFEFSPDGRALAFTERGKTPSTYDLALAEEPRWERRLVGMGVPSFQFSPDGKYLARIEGQQPGAQGWLVVGALNAKAGRKVAERVNEYAFAPDSKALAYLERYDETARAGVLGVVSLPEGKPQVLGYRVPNFTWSPDGKRIAYVARFLKPIFSVDLMLHELGAEKAEKVQTGVFGYGFEPSGDTLYFRSGCIRGGRACDLYTVDLKASPRTPVKAVEGIYSFKSAEEGTRMMITYARVDSDLYDVALYDPTPKVIKIVDRKVRLPVLFGDDQGHSVVYLVGERGRGGLYAATSVELGADAQKPASPPGM